MMVAQCGLADYEVGYMAQTSNITDDTVKGFISGVSESSNNMLISTNDVLLSGLRAKEALMINNTAGDMTTLCVCYQGNMLWYCLVTRSQSKDATANAMKFFNSFKLSAQPTGQTTVILQTPQSPTVNGSGNESNGSTINWTIRKSQTAKGLLGVTFGNGMFVAVGLDGIILTSSDGANWTSMTIDNVSILNGVAYGNGMFLAIGMKKNSGGIDYAVALTSTDGVRWSEGDKLPGCTSSECVTFGNGVFLVGGVTAAPQSGNPLFPMCSSPDGVNWTPVQAPNGIDSVEGIAYGNHLFVAIDVSGTIMTSPDGAAWTIQKPGQGLSTTSPYSLDGVAYGNNTFVAVGGSGTLINPTAFYNNGVILTSSDGTNWNNQSSGYQDCILGVAFGNQTFVALGSDGVILTSEDGQTWANQQTGLQVDLVSVAYGNNTFVAVGDKGSILQSDAIEQDSGQQ
jgi:hypothetical protein